MINPTPRKKPKPYPPRENKASDLLGKISFRNMTELSQKMGCSRATVYSFLSGKVAAHKGLLYCSIVASLLPPEEDRANLTLLEEHYKGQLSSFLSKTPN